MRAIRGTGEGRRRWLRTLGVLASDGSIEPAGPTTNPAGRDRENPLSVDGDGRPLRHRHAPLACHGGGRGDVPRGRQRGRRHAGRGRDAGRRGAAPQQPRRGRDRRGGTSGRPGDHGQWERRRSARCGRRRAPRARLTDAGDRAADDHRPRRRPGLGVARRDRRAPTDASRARTGDRCRHRGCARLRFAGARPGGVRRRRRARSRYGGRVPGGRGGPQGRSPPAPAGTGALALRDRRRRRGRDVRRRARPRPVGRPAPPRLAPRSGGSGRARDGAGRRAGVHVPRPGGAHRTAPQSRTSRCSSSCWRWTG